MRQLKSMQQHRPSVEGLKGSLTLTKSQGKLILRPSSSSELPGETKKTRKKVHGAKPGGQHGKSVQLLPPLYGKNPTPAPAASTKALLNADLVTDCFMDPPLFHRFESDVSKQRKRS